MRPGARRRAPAPPPLAVLIGPTASGKSELAMAIAARQPVEILVADSRQVYRGMDVGTAKPGVGERNAVRHHLLDRVTPDQPFTLADWLSAARATVPQVAARGRLPLVVGGTGLYVSGLVDGYELPGPAPSPEARRRLAEEMEEEGLAASAERLRRLDPDLAATVDLHNPRRVIRALERASGDAPGARAEPYPGRVAMIGLRRPREVLYRRIDERARAMFVGGLLDEVARLRSAGYGPELPPMTGHGYREAGRVLDGEWSVEQAIEVTARHTRQYAKRQLTWFRRDLRIVWLDAGDLRANEPRLVDRAVDLLRRMLAG
ncbi:MAG TPA: tRNA (adenosine(37)-N6)-dimethylallyltransferase MiaA [Candidatus Limnocylindria bacterium]|nr:tRNA (adenosine(37)-N6)-dimethylallyltransferase MiaA [Candidatus Limnocylindria bacterium]